MQTLEKEDFLLTDIRRYLEPGSIALVSSAWQGKANIMTMGWHMMMGFSPTLFACYIWDGNHSFEMLKKSRQCVINLPTTDLVEEVVGIGNCSGDAVDKFEAFGLTRVAASRVDAPLIGECYANFESHLADASQIAKHGLFIWEVVKAHVAVTPEPPQTLHYRGEGEFMLSGRAISRRSRFKSQNL